jgi:hypothetical protein
VESRIFLNRNGFRLSVDGSSGREYELAGPAGEHGLKQGEGSNGVVAEEGFRVQHGLAGFDQGGKMKHAVKRLAEESGGREKAFKRGPVFEFPLHEFDARGKQIDPPVAEVVENHDMVAPIHQKSRNSTSDVACPSGNQNLHKKIALSRAVWVTVSLLHIGQSRDRGETPAFRLAKKRLADVGSVCRLQRSQGMVCFSALIRRHDRFRSARRAVDCRNWIECLGRNLEQLSVRGPFGPQLAASSAL